MYNNYYEITLDCVALQFICTINKPSGPDEELKYITEAVMRQMGFLGMACYILMQTDKAI